MTSYFITGLSWPLAIVGDAIFASSMGGSATRFDEQFQNNKKKLLTLPRDTDNLRQLIHSVGAKLVVIDPIVAAMDSLEYARQTVEVHRFFETVAHGLIDQRMIG